MEYNKKEINDDVANSPVTMLPGIGGKRAETLSRLGINTILDLLLYFPKSHIDRRKIARISDLTPGQLVTVKGTVDSVRVIRMRKGVSSTRIMVSDDSGSMAITFFGQGYLAQGVFQPGKCFLFSGTSKDFNGITLGNPTYEIVGDDEDDLVNSGRITPVYGLTDGISQRQLRSWIYTALSMLNSGLEETLPEDLLKKHQLPAISYALPNAHFPDTPDNEVAARKRFVYEELLALQLVVLRERASRQKDNGISHVINGPRLRGIGKTLSFTLTTAQDRVISGLLRDMGAAYPMAQLLQGDVGSGKTVVALHCIAAALDGGYQVAFMVPTEILVEQHMMNLRPMLEPLGVRIGLLTGSVVGAKAVRQNLARGNLDVVVGTHALFQESTQFKKLGLVIIDEQHRFGVLQRNALISKGNQPDILHMSATPIPRSLALTIYGGLDISTLNEMPPGRKPVKTLRIPDHKLPELYHYLCEQVTQGRQGYIVCPLIEETEGKDTLKSVLSHYDELCAGPLSRIRVALLHGKMESRVKDAVMTAFQAGQIDILISTTVIEVGVDVPNATTMVIENAPRFGLTQLHQLRGRVGRGTEQSYCFLTGTPTTLEGKKRMEIICSETDGFAIAEADLALRGPGEFLGVRQTGISDLRIANLATDAPLLELARSDALEILGSGCNLNRILSSHMVQRVQQLSSIQG